MMKKWLFLMLALALVLALAACGEEEKTGEDIYPEDGYGEGRIGDVMHSVFMDFTVDSAYTADSYHGHEPPEGMQVLVVQMTIKNTFKESLPMWDDDFQAQWTASGDTGEFSYPITDDGLGNDVEVVSDEQLPPEYELAVKESRTGTLVFDVPADEKDFSISHEELFDDGTEGDCFFVYFTAEQPDQDNDKK